MNTWALQSNTIHLEAGAQTLKFVVKEGFNLDYFTIGSAVKTTVDTITEGAINGKTIKIDLTDGSFNPNLTKENWKLLNLPDGVDFDITRDSDTSATITLKGEASSDFDADKTVIVSISAKELISGDSKDYNLSSDFKITANNDAETLSTDKTILMNATDFTVTLNGGTFVADKVSGITLSRRHDFKWKCKS